MEHAEGTVELQKLIKNGENIENILSSSCAQPISWVDSGYPKSSLGIVAISYRDKIKFKAQPKKCLNELLFFSSQVEQLY